ncbi:hypothetical protein [Tolypothrix sp. NIES-4075]|nr:hypothetical protein [Tolypothrix sp. NIES-4075]
MCVAPSPSPFFSGEGTSADALSILLNISRQMILVNFGGDRYQMN